MKTTKVTTEANNGLSPQTLLARFNCGPVKFTGGDNALYERHLTFDQVIPPEKVTPRDSFEAVARSVRDVLSQRWLKTEETYQRQNTKRVYYLSLEFLMGRALANNITNLMLDPVWSHFCKRHMLDPLEILEVSRRDRRSIGEVGSDQIRTEEEQLAVFIGAGVDRKALFRTGDI